MNENQLSAELLVPLLIDSYMRMSKFSSDIAYARRTLYDAYLSEGFEPNQALELCKIL